MREVKRYDAVHIRYEENNIRYGGGLGVEMVTARDYDALRAEAEALRAQRDKLAGLLTDTRDTYRYAIHWEDLHPVMKQIDAALTEIKP